VTPQAAGYVRAAPSVLAQKLAAPTFVVNTRVELRDPADGDRAGLILNAMQYAWLGLRKTAGATELVYTTCTPAKERCKEASSVVLPAAPSMLYLRMNMGEGAVARFAYSTDNVSFTPVGEPFTVSKGRWVGAQVGLFSVGDKAGASSLDVDYFRVTAN
jgi:beta-xylosidase